MKYILSPCTICLPHVLRRWIPFRLFQHMFRYLWITMLQKSLILLYLNNSLSICLPHQLHHLPLAPYLSWLTLIVYILTQNVNSPLQQLQFLAVKKTVEPFKLHPTSMSYIYKVFEHLKQLWMGIWQHIHTVTTTEVCPDLGELAEIMDDVSVEIIQLRYR